MHYRNIPIFLPELACPHRCVYCDQSAISGKKGIPDEETVHWTIRKHLSTIHKKNTRIHIAFFGGSFTGLPGEIQEQYLKVAQTYVDEGRVDGIRISTRPDYISSGVLQRLKTFKVECIELGVQSLDPQVLEASGRGHSINDVAKASRAIKDAGFVLVLQMMTGLPGDTWEKTMDTARQIANLGASQVRIYPTLVIKNTPLEKMMLQGEYQPLSMEEAVTRCARLADFFEEKNIGILRMGLHPSLELTDGSKLVAGPYHPAFGEMVNSKRWQNRLLKWINPRGGSLLTLYVAPEQLNAAIGHGGSNRLLLKKHYDKVIFKSSPDYSGKDCYVDAR